MEFLKRFRLNIYIFKKKKNTGLDTNKKVNIRFRYGVIYF